MRASFNCCLNNIDNCSTTLLAYFHLNARIVTKREIYESDLALPINERCDLNIVWIINHKTNYNCISNDFGNWNQNRIIIWLSHLKLTIDILNDKTKLLKLFYF